MSLTVFSSVPKNKSEILVCMSFSFFDNSLVTAYCGGSIKQAVLSAVNSDPDIKDNIVGFWQPKGTKSNREITQ